MVGCSSCCTRLQYSLIIAIKPLTAMELESRTSWFVSEYTTI